MGSSFLLSIAAARCDGIGWKDNDTSRGDVAMADLGEEEEEEDGGFTLISWGISTDGLCDLLLVDLFWQWSVD